MSTPDGPVLECTVSFRREAHGRKRLGPRRETIAVTGRVPRISRLVALAVKLDGQIRAGELRDWADVARLGHITRARSSQIAALTLLTPDIIESILHLPVVENGHDPISERDLRPIATEPSWSRQRRLFRDLISK